jgi:phosphatidylglycerophosphatase A
MTSTEAPDSIRPRQPRTVKDRFAIIVATAGGAGFFPVAPGTMGALVGVVLYLLVLGSGVHVIYLPLTGALTLLGIWAAGHVERIYGHDAARIVIDEVVGQMLTLGFVMRSGTSGIAVGTILGFLLFRIFDILKPFPIRRIEQLPGGLGVVADDLAAGVYAFLILLILEPYAAGVATAS